MIQQVILMHWMIIISTSQVIGRMVNPLPQPVTPVMQVHKQDSSSMVIHVVVVGQKVAAPMSLMIVDLFTLLDHLH